MSLKVNEIFASIDGEGITAGYPTVFVRLFGCNLKCSYCDTRYSCEGSDFQEMEVEEIVEKVMDYGLHRVTLTGGEPLLQDEAIDLVKHLTNVGIRVNVETNGSVSIRKVRSAYPFAGLVITMDYKCPSSRMEDQMCLDNLHELCQGDVLKFVVGSKADLDQMRRVTTIARVRCNVFVSPVFGKIEPSEIVEYLLRYKLGNVRLQLQLHKFIWDPNKRGV